MQYGTYYFTIQEVKNIPDFSYTIMRKSKTEDFTPFEYTVVSKPKKGKPGKAVKVKQTLTTTTITTTRTMEDSELPKTPIDVLKKIEADVEATKPAAPIMAQEILEKPLQELKQEANKRETHNLLQDLRIITAIMLGKDKNKELSQALNTDKSFTSKQIRQLEDQGLVHRQGEGKETRYEVDRFNVMKFLESRVVIKWGKDEKDSAQQNMEKKDGTTDTKENS